MSKCVVSPENVQAQAREEVELVSWWCPRIARVVGPDTGQGQREGGGGFVEQKVCRGISEEGVHDS